MLARARGAKRTFVCGGALPFFPFVGDSSCSVLEGLHRQYLTTSYFCFCFFFFFFFFFGPSQQESQR